MKHQPARFSVPVINRIKPSGRSASKTETASVPLYITDKATSDILWLVMELHTELSSHEALTLCI